MWTRLRTASAVGSCSLPLLLARVSRRNRTRVADGTFVAWSTVVASCRQAAEEVAATQEGTGSAVASHEGANERAEPRQCLGGGPRRNVQHREHLRRVGCAGGSVGRGGGRSGHVPCDAAPHSQAALPQPEPMGAWDGKGKRAGHDRAGLRHGLLQRRTAFAASASAGGSCSRPPRAAPSTSAERKPRTSLWRLFMSHRENQLRGR